MPKVRLLTTDYWLLTMKQHYSPEEADAILGRAVKDLPLPGDLSREQLLKTAKEVGVTPEQLEAAEAEYRRTVETQEFWAAYRAYRLRKVLAILPAMLPIIVLVFLRGEGSDSWAHLIPLFLLPFMLAVGIGVAKTATCQSTSALGERKLRRFIAMRKRMGLSVPSELNRRDY